MKGKSSRPDGMEGDGLCFLMKMCYTGPMDKKEPETKKAAAPEAPSAYVYMVRCRDGSLYTGWTTDVAARVAAHNAGQGAKYTRSRLPVTLAYWEAAEDKSAALRREAAIKKLSRAAKEKLIKEGL